MTCSSACLCHVPTQNFVEVARDKHEASYEMITSRLRDALMPLYDSTIRTSEDFLWNELHGKNWFNEDHAYDQEHQKILEHFKTYEMDVTLNPFSKRSYNFKTRVIESKASPKKMHTVFMIGGNRETSSNALHTRVVPLLSSFLKHAEPDQGLKVIFLSYYQNEVKEKGETKEWAPHSTDELASAPMEVLKALNAHGIQVDTLMTHSLGAMIFESLKNLSLKKVDLVPKNIVINRGFTSMDKVITKLNPGSYISDTSVKGHVLKNLAYLFNWNASPEKELYNFFSRVQETCPDKLKDRKVVIVESKRDHYFSKDGAFDEDFHQKLKELGLATYRGSFYVPQWLTRIHHSMPDDYLKSTHGSDLDDFLPMKPNQSLSDLLAEQILCQK